MDFVEVVSAVMAEKGITQYALGKATGIDSAILSRFLARQSRIRSDLLEKIFDFLEIEARKKLENNCEFTDSGLA